MKHKEEIDKLLQKAPRNTVRWGNTVMLTLLISGVIFFSKIYIEKRTEVDAILVQINGVSKLVFKGSIKESEENFANMHFKPLMFYADSSSNVKDFKKLKFEITDQDVIKVEKSVLYLSFNPKDKVFKNKPEEGGIIFGKIQFTPKRVYLLQSIKERLSSTVNP